MPETVLTEHLPASRLNWPDEIRLGLLTAEAPFVARARALGGRIDTRRAGEDAQLRALAAHCGLSVVFRYGAVVSFGCSEAAAEALDSALMPYVTDAASPKEIESALITVRADTSDRIGTDGQIRLEDASDERLMLVAIVLARNVVLSRHEESVSEAFERIAPLVSELHDQGRTRLPIKSAMQLLGRVLAARHRVTGSVQADERPDVLWDHPELDRLYARLDAEYELGERAEVLEHKFQTLGEFTEVLLDIVRDKRTFRLELAVIGLIAFEIVLSLITMAGHH